MALRGSGSGVGLQYYQCQTSVSESKIAVASSNGTKSELSKTTVTCRENGSHGSNNSEAAIPPASNRREEQFRYALPRPRRASALCPAHRQAPATQDATPMPRARASAPHRWQPRPRARRASAPRSTARRPYSQFLAGERKERTVPRRFRSTARGVPLSTCPRTSRVGRGRTTRLCQAFEQTQHPTQPEESSCTCRASSGCGGFCSQRLPGELRCDPTDAQQRMPYM